MNTWAIRFSFLLVSAFLVQCGTVQPVRSEREQFKEVYISQFKLTYFRKILAAGFNHSEAVKDLIRFDRSGFTEPVLSEHDYRLIDSLVYLDNQYMVKDSASSIGTVAEGAQGKHVLGYILNRLESKWLDRLATRRYKQSGRKGF
ncbi:MAG TPA: hypothetical protein VGB46_04920 [Flavisolibacter sp.]